VGDQHLVIVAAPRAIRDLAKVVNGPAWYPEARVRLVGSTTINGWEMQSVYVPQETNDGSAFVNHVALIWTVGDHTYAIGFHDVRGVQKTAALNAVLARGIRLVGP